MPKPEVPSAGEHGRKQREWPRRLVLVVLLLAGIVVTLWPIGETYRNDQASVEVAEQYTQTVERSIQTEPQAVSAQVEQARAYNAALPPEKLNDPWGDAQRLSATDEAHNAYLTQLSLFDAMARVVIPKIDVDLPIVHDSDQAALARGAGHMYGSSLPVGGTNTHAVIAAHTAYTGYTFFDRLPEMRQGDTFRIEVYGTRLDYQVDQLTVVEADDLEHVQRIAGGDYVTLLTCVKAPDGHWQRLLVRGVRIASPTETQTDTTTTTSTRTTIGGENGLIVQDWMQPRLVIAGSALVMLTLFAISWLVAAIRRPRRTDAEVVAPQPTTARRAAD